MNMNVYVSACIVKKTSYKNDFKKKLEEIKDTAEAIKDIIK